MPNVQIELSCDLVWVDCPMNLFDILVPGDSPFGNVIHVHIHVLLLSLLFIVVLCIPHNYVLHPHFCPHPHTYTHTHTHMHRQTHTQTHTQRFLRHVPVIYVDYPAPASLRQIYGTFNRAMLRLVPNLRAYSDPLTEAMVDFYSMSQVNCNECMHVNDFGHDRTVVEL